MPAVERRWTAAEVRVLTEGNPVVERWRPGDTRPEITSEMLSWQPAGATTPFVCELGPLFAEALGE